MHVPSLLKMSPLINTLLLCTRVNWYNILYCMSVTTRCYIVFESFNRFEVLRQALSPFMVLKTSIMGSWSKSIAAVTLLISTTCNNNVAIGYHHALMQGTAADGSHQSPV